MATAVVTSAMASAMASAVATPRPWGGTRSQPQPKENEAY
jgi:hypothetical protein